MLFDIRLHIIKTDRYKLYFFRCTPGEMGSVSDNITSQNISVLNLGAKYAEALKTIKDSRFIDLEAPELLHKLFNNEARAIDSEDLKIIAIHNLGILFEPTLGLNPENILLDIAKNIAVIIIWPFTVIDGALIWDIDNKKQKFDFTKNIIKEIK
jgi:hypothetical protein